MRISAEMNAYSCLFVLLTAVSSKHEISALTGSFCKTVQGEVPNTKNFTWYIPLVTSGTYANINVKVSSDLILGLVTNCDLARWSSYKYKVLFGSTSNTKSAISRLDMSAPLVWSNTAGILNATAYVPLWLSWSDGVISGGTGPVVGVNSVMNYMDPSPTPINCLLIGGWTSRGDVTVTYCYQPRIFDQSSPIDQPSIANVVATELDCARQCDDDIQCQGYAVVCRHVTTVGQTSCMIYYSISGLQYDPNYVLFVVGNYTSL